MKILKKIIISLIFKLTFIGILVLCFYSFSKPLLMNWGFIYVLIFVFSNLSALLSYKYIGRYTIPAITNCLIGSLIYYDSTQLYIRIKFLEIEMQELILAFFLLRGFIISVPSLIIGFILTRRKKKAELESEILI